LFSCQNNGNDSVSVTFVSRKITKEANSNSVQRLVATTTITTTDRKGRWKEGRRKFGCEFQKRGDGGHSQVYSQFN
jgi:hypothetical protein